MAFAILDGGLSTCRPIAKASALQPKHELVWGFTEAFVLVRSGRMQSPVSASPVRRKVGEHDGAGQQVWFGHWLPRGWCSQMDTKQSEFSLSRCASYQTIGAQVVLEKLVEAQLHLPERSDEVMPEACANRGL